MIYRVRARRPIHPSNPLHVGWFYPDKQRNHRQTMQDRQDLILYLASLHESTLIGCLESKMPRGFCEVPLRLGSLREWVHDYRIVLDHFFDIKSLGYAFSENAHEISTLIPKNIGSSYQENLLELELEYIPPEKIEHAVISKVYIQTNNAPDILRKIAATGRSDLKLPVEWLLKHPEHNFHFLPAGRLQQRDTSVWPVAGIETWPAWLREALFGRGIDIESAYTQYLLQMLTDIYAGNQRMLKMLYPDIVRSVSDKWMWRCELCVDLGMVPSEESISIIKKICMSLANGSRISPEILKNGNRFSDAAFSILKNIEDASDKNLTKIGSRLQSISRQYSLAKKAICTMTLGLNTTKRNQKRVFASYFEWERVARYLIWEEVGRHGIMVHDGIDGVPDEYLRDVDALIKKIGLKVTA